MSTSPSAGGSHHAMHHSHHIGRFEVKQFQWVCAAGMAGGTLFWFLGAWSGQPAFPGWPAYGQILALMFIGSMAALFGVYLLTASNLNAMRTYVFAIVCGLVWQPIISSARDSVTAATASRTVVLVNGEADQLQNAAAHGDSQQVQSAVTVTVPAVTEAITTLGSVKNADKKQQIVDSSKAAIASLEAASGKAPQPSIQGIQKIAMAAGQAHQTDVGVHALQSLHAIAMAAKLPEVLKQSQQSIQTIAQNSSDPALRKAAEVSLRDILAQRAAERH